MSTIRDHLDAIISDATEWTVKEVAHAEAALKLLDEAERLSSVEGVCGGEEGTHRLVPDSP